MSSQKPIQIETKTTASFAKINKRKSILLAENERNRLMRMNNQQKVSFMNESLKELFKPKDTSMLTEEAIN
jgi:hypothetical protein